MTEIILWLLAVVLVFGIMIPFEASACHSKWSGNPAILESSYGPIKGCMIRTKDGWIPSENYRVL